MQIKNFQPRLYQEAILQTALKKNTLIILPTGMGKTKTAILIALERLKSYPNSKILFLTPTKPLALQIQREFQDSTTIEPEKIQLFTGEISPEKREGLSENAKVIISTPQTISNDVINSKIHLKEFSALILDEAHRCVKDYDYTWIAKQYNKQAQYPRIIGLTASPGTDVQSIEEVCKNAFIEEVEVRTEEDPDVKPYIQEVDVNWIKVDLPPEFLEIKELIDNCYKSRLSLMKELNITNKSDFSKKELLTMLGQFQGQLVRGQKDFQTLKGISLTAELIKIQHAQEMLETQGIDSLYVYMKKLFEEAENTKTKSIKNLAKDLNFHSAYIKAKELVSKNIQHPKLIKLREIITEEIKDNIKIMIFNQYRDSAKITETELNKIPGVKAKIFVGQQKKGDTGLSQKKQEAVLNQLRNGEINVLISTSIGEEGLDIPKVDIVIFFEPIPSAIRSIQRRGRTGRTEKGKIIVLMTKNTRDETYHWVAFHKEKQMYMSLKKIKDRLKFKTQQTLSDFKDTTKTTKIIADSRENGSAVIKHLSSLGLEITTENIPTADYIINDRIGIERKTPEDFVKSIIDKRLLNQLKELREKFPIALLILEGDADIYSIRKIHPNAIHGMISTITIDYNIPMIYTKNPLDTANLINVIAKREVQNKDKVIGVRLERKPLTTREQQEFILESFPGIGPSLAKALLTKFKTINNIINATEEQLQEIDLLGPKKAKEIKQILDEIY